MTSPIVSKSWSGPVVIGHHNDSRVIGPFSDVQAATTWLRTIPNALFQDLDTLERDRADGDLFLAPLEDPETAIQGRSSLEHGPEWDLDWSGVPDEEALELSRESR